MFDNFDFREFVFGYQLTCYAETVTPGMDVWFVSFNLSTSRGGTCMRKLLLFALVAMVLVPVTMAQVTVTLGSTACSPQTPYLPWYHFYEYSEAQYGIPASELATVFPGPDPVMITQIGWYLCSATLPTSLYSLNIYMAEVPSSYNLAGLCTTSLDNFANGVQVASANTLSGTTPGIVMTTLDTPFTYNPGNALIITICNIASGYSSSVYWAGNSFTGNGRYRYRDGTPYDCNMATAEGGSTGCTNLWLTTAFGYSVASGYDLTMLTPGGAGSGTVSPPVGTYTYPVDSTANISATPAFGSVFDYWELDGAWYSDSATETVLMDDDHTVQAFFEPIGALALPFCEDFTGVATGSIPNNWQKVPNTTNWGATASANAGGVAPEMTFYYYPSQVNQFRLITPLLDGTSLSEITLWFNHYVNHYSTPYDLRVQTSLDGGTTWTTQWTIAPTGAMGPEQVFVNLNDMVGEEFHLAFVFDGDSWNINYWHIDDMCVGEPPDLWNLEMLSPYGQGAVSPPVGLHEMILGGTEQFIAGLPSSTWYGHNAYPGNDLVTFDPMTPGTLFVLGTNTAPNFLPAGTWADGVWYAAHYDAGSSNLYTVDTTTGALTLVGATGAPLNGIAYDEVNDIMYGAASYNLYTINRSTGTATMIGGWGSSYLMIDIGFGGGVLYGHDIITDSIYTINTSTGAATLVGATGFSCNYAQGMEYDKDQGRLFLSAYTTQGMLAEVDPATGHGWSWGNFQGGAEVCALAIPYGVFHPWEFDHWEVDGAYYSDQAVDTLLMDADYTVQAFFMTTGDTVELTMLAPGGPGVGTVSPAPGVHLYVEGQTATLSAVGDPGYMLDYWEVDGAWYSDNGTTTLLMDVDHTAQAFFGIDTTMGCDPSWIFSQPVVAETVFTTSDANGGYISADDFVGLVDPIMGVEFWGAELQCCWGACTKTNLNFNVRFYEYGSLPGALVHEEVVTMTRIVTQELVFGSATYGYIKKYSGWLATPVTMAQGWVGIQAVDSGACWFLWGDGGPSGASGTYQYAQNAGSGWASGGYGMDLALCLLGAAGVPAPTNCAADPAEVCAEEAVTLTADSFFDIYWFDDMCGGNLVGTGSPLVVNPLVTTTYYAQAYDPVEDEWSATCCDIEVQVNPLPGATASSNSPITAPIPVGDDLELYGGPDGMVWYSWTGPGGWTSTEQNPIIVAADETWIGTYTLTVFDGVCEDVAATNVWIGDPPPIPTMGLTGIGLLLLAVGSLMSFARRRK